MDKDIFKRIIIENHEFIGRIELIKRDFSLEESGNYVLTGSRRAGKTFLMFQVISEMIEKGMLLSRILYINFEDERLIELKGADLGLILDAYKELFAGEPILFLDEIQNVEGWEKFARRLADTGYRVFITGSNAQMLSKEIATTLGGRFIIREIFPLSFAEYLQANGIVPGKNWEYESTRFDIRRLFDDYFFFGGFPEIIRFKEKRLWLNNLYQKIFYGDLIARYKIRNEFALKLMIKKMAESLHDEVSFNRIRHIIQSAGVKIGTATVIEYSLYLEETWLMFSIRNYLSKISERESQKKYYFVDNGILNLFLNNPETILLENIVACRLRRLYGEEVYYVRAQSEVDFYIPAQRTLLQVAYAMNSPETERRETEALIKVSSVVEADRLCIITLDLEKNIQVGGRSIELIPVWKWLLREKG